MWISNFLGLSLMAAIVWWFWLYKPREAVLGKDGVINVTVENGVYVPSRIQIPVNQSTILRFLRKDATPCAETVIFNGLNVSSDLPVDQPKDIELHPNNPGKYSFTCQMQMYKGEIEVTEN